MVSPRSVDITGHRFGRLVAIAYCGRSKNRGAMWQCACDCGRTVVVMKGNLVRGNSKSCGCARSETCRAVGDRVRTHGMSKTATYRVWCGMMERCRRETSKDFPRYGGRGITVCERWEAFENFLADMGEKPTGMSIDRIDNNKGYSKENCRWATPRQQNINRRISRMVTINGETKCITEWFEQSPLAESTIRRRMSMGMSLEEALWTPRMKRKSGKSASPAKGPAESRTKTFPSPSARRLGS